MLDTNVISELRKRAGAADRHVLGWAAGQDVEDLFLSVVSVMELELGITRIERRDSRQGEALRAWFERAVIGDLADRILPITLAVARRTAAMHVPDPRPDRDAYIAATAQVHGLTVVTRNVADFVPMGVAFLNPWER
ncbi:type II toxin-antitoxin system VapC family toxin [Mycobacterium heidelbergense]|uniref:type II toxin-antitoxin system VapC family toxin n=1 Tax=Mycobacterium heidelbergense TaxID=53376 RepID=UPI00138B8E78|nr:type II toxin-antitoxin system VapC family toxin [Mycobacterium heidelbergense]BBZ51386.1 twitching motility protein PilT [Mycobacterium heidelbergense]